MWLFFALALFLSAWLLFWLQPMAGKVLLPALGGTPAVWNTCMVFFQVGLLAGYGYAHVGPGRLGTRWHAVLHIGLLLLSLTMVAIPLMSPDLPPDGAALIHLGTAAPPKEQPVLWLLKVLTLSVGLPFVLLAATAPLVQRWFAESGRRAAGDPYFLYAASNLGSLLALACYPVVIEPMLPLPRQSLAWFAGYAGLVLLLGFEVVVTWRPRSANTDGVPPAATAEDAEQRREGPADAPPTYGRRLRWFLLALVPSSLLLSVTTHLTTDLAPVPLLWVLPLALYLLTFVLAFARRQWINIASLARITPGILLVLVLLLLIEGREPAMFVLSLHLIGFFVIALVCHGELARLRPPRRYLTEYYLWLAAGGAAGGVFNALIAPLIFNRLLEYPLGLVAVALLRPSSSVSGAGAVRWSRWDLILPGLVAVLATAGLVATYALAIPAGPWQLAALYGLPLLTCYALHERRWRFAAALATILLASAFAPDRFGVTEYRVRSFFGAYRVTRDEHFRYFFHGGTMHGQQSLDPNKQREPLTYYHDAGPIGRFSAEFKGDPRLQRVAVIGLGTGAMASYAQPGQRWTFVEIDPAVIDIARKHFTYLEQSRGQIDVAVGDGRIVLDSDPERFGLIVVDAFNSDAIPVHLLTREAMALYKKRLAPGGILAFHVSNRYLELAPILANLAAEGPQPMICLSRRSSSSPEQKEQGQWAAHWVVLVSREADRARLSFWIEVSPNPAYPVWTDDFSNLFQVLRWSE